VTANGGATASFAINTYTLTYSAGAHGSITGTSPQTVASGTDGTLVTAVPATGYHFASWSDGYPTAARTDTNVTANHAVTASFASNKLPTTTTLRASATTILRGRYITLTARLLGGSHYTTEYLRFEVIGSGLLHYKVYKAVKVSSTGYATYRYRIMTRGTRYHRVEFAGSRSYLPAPIQHGIKLTVR
jgi:hypothetical protein